MAPPVPVSSGTTPASTTTTQVMTTDAASVGDTLYLSYAADFGTIAGMPNLTVAGESTVLVDEAHNGDNALHVRTYLVVCASAGTKSVTVPAHGGGDIMGHWSRFGETLAVDQHTNTTHPAADATAHVANGVVTTAPDEILLCTWATGNTGAFTAGAYATPAGMAELSEIGSANFADSLVGGEGIAVAGATGTRTATWPQAKAYAAVTASLRRAAVLGNITVDTTDTDVSVTGASQRHGNTTADTTDVTTAVAGAGHRAGALTVDTTDTSVSVTGSSDLHAPISDVLCSSWANVADVSPRQRERLADITDLELAGWLLRASEILWALSGRRWLGGGCSETATLRQNPPGVGNRTWPFLNAADCGCWGDLMWQRLPPVNFAHGSQPFAVKLPREPITAVTAVTVDGVPFTSWQALTSAGWVERTDGQPWPTCGSDITIAYDFGVPPPGGGRDAAVELGVELALAATGGTDCSLPDRVTTITRQGLSIQVNDWTDVFTDRRTGLFTVDLWLNAVNPEHRSQAATIHSMDIPRAVRY